MGKMKDWFRKHLYYSKATICIRGLVFSHSLVNHGIVGLLMVYLTELWRNEHFQMAAVVTNVQDGLSDTMVILLAHFSHSYRGSFKIIVTTNAAYIAGLAILWFSVQHRTADTATMVYYGAALLLTFGEAGRSAALNEFLDKQYSSENGIEFEDEEDLQDHQKALWGLPWLLGAVVPLFLVKTTWEQIFMISTIVMGVFYLLFWCGYSFYFINSIREETARENIGSLIEKRKARQNVKQILAMWLIFLVYSVVIASGSTFFFEQMSNLRVPIKNYDIAIYFTVLSSFCKYAISYIWELVFSKKKKTRAVTLVRIGCGLACTVLCSLAAWLVEIRRLKKVKEQGVGDTSEVIPMSIFRLVPQFALLGFMQGLAEDGLIEFFVQRVADDHEKMMVEYYASHTKDFVIGVGKLLTALGILAFSRRRWFNDSINISRLDKYYRVLTFLSLLGFFFYVFLSIRYYSKDESQESSEDDQNETDSHRTETQETSPPSPQESVDFLYHQQPPQQHEPSTLAPQYYPQQYPPPEEAYYPQQSYPPAA